MIKVDGVNVPARTVKGSPETFDLEAITERMKLIKSGAPVSWPVYDRKIHDPIFDAIRAENKGVIIIEGNYLLLDEPGWKDLKRLANFSIFIESDAEIVRNSVVARHQRGGRSLEDAKSYYEFSDARNVRRVMNERLSSDVILRTESGHRIIKIAGF